MKLSRYEIAAIKKTAQITKPKRAKMAKLIAKRDALDNEINTLQNEIDLWEAPIITKHGYSSEQILSGEADEIASQTENMPEVPVGTVDYTEEAPFENWTLKDRRLEETADIEAVHTSASVDEDPFKEPEL